MYGSFTKLGTRLPGTPVSQPFFKAVLAHDSPILPAHPLFLVDQAMAPLAWLRPVLRVTADVIHKSSTTGTLVARLAENLPPQLRPEDNHDGEALPSRL